MSVSETADETGIVVAGLGVDGHGYLIEDASGKFSPIEWARRAVMLYHQATRPISIIAEANQGGAMVETTVRTVEPERQLQGRFPPRRSKITRAEPVAALSKAKGEFISSGRVRNLKTNYGRSGSEARPLLRTGWTRWSGRSPN